VQPVGELDEQHADVAAHRDDHLADRLGLSALAVLDLVELGDAVHEHRDFVPEVGGQLVERVVGVFDRVMQQRGRDGPGAQAEVGEDLRHGQRMRDVRLTALAHLPRVRALRNRVGPLDDREIALGVMGANRAQQLLDIVATRRPGEDPRYEPAKRRGLRGRGR
jgi:hypothetical protein